MIIVGPLLGLVGFSLMLSGYEWLTNWESSFDKKVWGFVNIVVGTVICLIAFVI